MSGRTGGIEPSIKRIKRHMEWSADLRAGLIPRKRYTKQRKRLEQPKERRRVISLSERAGTLIDFAKGQLATYEDKVTVDELLIWLLNKEEERIHRRGRELASRLPMRTVKAIDDFLEVAGPESDNAARQGGEERNQSAK